MQRDGALTSLWQYTMPGYPRKLNDVPEGTQDVLVIGGGITGITTAYLLQRAGLQVTLAEAHSIAFGTTGGTTAHLNTIMDNTYDVVISDFGENNAQLLARACHEAIDLVEKNVLELDINCDFTRLPGFLYAEDAAQLKKLEDIVSASQKAGVDIQFSDAIPLPLPFVKAAVVQNQAQIHPTRYVYALGQAFENAGGIILENCFADTIEEKAGIQVAQTSLGQIKARKVVYATHIPPGINLLHFRCAPYRSYAMAVKLAGGNYPEALVYDLQDPYHYFRSQMIDGDMYMIVGGEDHKTAHTDNTAQCFRNLEAYVRTYFNVDHVAFNWSSQYYEPADGLAYIGLLPGFSDHVYVATGFGGNGITYSQIAALVLRDLIVTGNSPYEALFRPGRIKPVAGFTGFIQENADVVKELVTGFLSRSELSSFSDLAAGEGRVVKYGGKAIALYRDEDGTLHAINPTCTHAKCTVSWNDSEKSWDCPCHGARYDKYGNILNGPARQPLAKIELRDL